MLVINDVVEREKKDNVDIVLSKWWDKNFEYEKICVCM